METTNNETDGTHMSTITTKHLRERILKTSEFESDTLYCRGFSKKMSEECVMHILSTIEAPCEVDFSMRSRFGTVWAKYRQPSIAHETINVLHQSIHYGASISLRFELGLNGFGKPIVPKSSHCTVIRHVLYKGQPYYNGKSLLMPKIQKKDSIYCEPCHVNIGTERLGVKSDQSDHMGIAAGKAEKDSTTPTKSSSNNILTAIPNNINYSHKSVIVGDLELPFPSGLYLTRLIALSCKYDGCDPLLTLLTKTALSKLQNKYAKEISEVMAMVDAVERGIKMAFKKHPNDYEDVNVYVVGDGQTPLCAAALCLHFPMTWRYFSIDPILIPIETTDLYHHRFHQISSFSQEFHIPHSNNNNSGTAEQEFQSNVLSIVVACHSHAPLQEFWDRMSTPKLTISMPCCSTYSNLDINPLFEFDDFEVYSAKRHIQIFAMNANV